MLGIGDPYRHVTFQAEDDPLVRVMVDVIGAARMDDERAGKKLSLAVLFAIDALYEEARDLHQMKLLVDMRNEIVAASASVVIPKVGLGQTTERPSPGP